ncbi:MAG: sigma-70 family RNA polymerase sigma factor [Planctomycetota bacterium]|nr:sigma-70 family RNA polymerase sigma factor [Planctomycetota bacterium]
MTALAAASENPSPRGQLVGSGAAAPPVAWSRRPDRAAVRRRRAEDVDLVEAILGGDDEAFRTLVERYQRPLFWLARDILLDDHEARDVVQETFLRVHGALDRFDRTRDLMNWMFRIARNLAIDHYRRRRRRAIPVETIGGSADTERRPDGGPLTAEPTVPGEDDLAARVAATLAVLPIEYRLCLTLREYHGLTPREIARVTDCSYPTARWRLHRARALFRAAWEARFGAETSPQGEPA